MGLPLRVTPAVSAAVAAVLVPCAAAQNVAGKQVVSRDSDAYVTLPEWWPDWPPVAWAGIALGASIFICPVLCSICVLHHRLFRCLCRCCRKPAVGSEVQNADNADTRKIQVKVRK